MPSLPTRLTATAEPLRICWISDRTPVSGK